MTPGVRISIFFLLLFPYLVTRRIFSLVFGRNKRNELFQKAGLGSTWDYLARLGIPSPIANWVDLRTRFGYEPEVTDFVSRIRGRVFYDIGAGTGHYSVLLSRNFKTIVAFEPDLRNFQHIIYAAMIGGLANIRVSNVAVSDFDGTATLYRSGVLWHSIARPTQEDKEPHVSTVRLDSVIGEATIDLVKIDVEGAEWHVLRGAKGSIRAGKIRRILIELHNTGRKDELERYLRQRCYSTVWLDSTHVFGEIILTTSDLAAKSCVPCEGATPFSPAESEQYLHDLPGWKVVDPSIVKEFRFKSYKAGLDFAYAVGKIAEEQDHHPDILVRWRRVRLTLSTHVIKGLSQNDFIMAAKSELEYQKYSSQ